MVQFTEQEFESINKVVRAVIRERPINDVIPFKPVKPSKEHIFLGAHEMPEVIEGADFSYDLRNYPARSETGVKCTFLTFPVKITATDQDISSSAGIESLLMTAEIEGASQMAKKIERVITHGSDKRGSLGMCNYAGLLSFGTDANKALTTAHNFQVQLQGALSAIRANHILPPYTLIWTPGIPSQLRGSNISGLQGEYSHFKETYLEGGMISRVIETDSICTSAAGKFAALSTSNQCFVVAKFGEPYNYVAEPYGLHRDGINKEFDADIGYATMWAGAFANKNSKAVCLVTGLTTASAY